MTPARPERPELAETPFLETWQYASGSRGLTEWNAVAHGVQTLLAEAPPVRVGTGSEESVRPLQRGDVAILCRSNGHCQALAKALRTRGIPALVRLDELAETEEAAVCVAALKLLVDPRDGVAAAMLSWLTGGGADDPDAWLSAQVQRHASCKAGEPTPLPFLDDPVVTAIRAERSRSQVLSPAEALDVCLVAADLPRRFLRFPDAAQRLANLESLRAAASAYEDLCRVRRVACTIAGLVGHLAGLVETQRNDDGDDVGGVQAIAPAADAVTVLTYHKAKGLEWPVVVLCDLDAQPKPRPFRTTVEASEGGFDGANPLEGRWLRHWPWPYGEQKSGIALLDAAMQTPEGRAESERERRERARLLYVGFTRPRDRLVLVGANHSKNGMKTTWLDELQDASGQSVLKLPWSKRGPSDAEVLEHKFRCFAREFDAAPPIAAATVPTERRWFSAPKAVQTVRVPELIRPSDVVLPEEIAARVTVGLPRVIGGRQPVRAPTEQMNDVGDALHRFLAADVTARRESVAAREAVAQRLLEAHGVALAISVQTLLAVSDALHAHLEADYPGARWLCEWPVRWRVPTPAGTRLMIGEVDLVLETDAGLVLIDHKSFPGAQEQRDRRTLAHAGQLAAYAAALESATGKKVLKAFIHFAVRGELVEVGVPTGACSNWLQHTAA